MDVDWAALRSAAITAMERAYAPYSNFPVGAAALVDDGRVVVGCNVENASYGLGLCAECGLVSNLRVTGGGRLVALACVDGEGRPLMPCGRCRQLLWEHGGPSLLIDHASGPLPMTALLPYAFDDTDLERFAAERDKQPTVPAALALKVGSGTVFVHPEIAAGQQVWTAYWERSSGTGDDERTGILEEGPTWDTAAEAVNWGRIRTPRVVVIDAQGTASWAGDTPRPAGIEQDWSTR
ncbi:cytidine deaminase [Dactylosporangium roseum]|uniref:Cytidine deaminase n=1 Tax=Dactylosporangium roseum TaxID=47989 RepID=A0ABY5Z770_9ACTN|nr:cytidine deaminase [Dactylosporangium roseum]UWZ37441.1 cytidine deaminase [Dactylosporangium roseum]